MRSIRSLFLVLGAGWALNAAALEYPIGSPQNLAGMEVGAVYLQAIDMEPEGHMRKASESDIHLEADIHALANNPNGFEEGAWIPHLLVKYELVKAGERGHPAKPRSRAWPPTKMTPARWRGAPSPAPSFRRSLTAIRSSVTQPACDG